MKRLGIINIDFGKLSGLMDLPEGHEVVDVRVLEWFEYGGREKVVQVVVSGDRMPEVGVGEKIGVVELDGQG